MINRDQFFMCHQCGLSYRFECCRNTSCNGGGCDECHELGEQIIAAFNVYYEETLNERPDMDDIDLIFGSMVAA